MRDLVSSFISISTFPLVTSLVSYFKSSILGSSFSAFWPSGWSIVARVTSSKPGRISVFGFVFGLSLSDVLL